MTDAGTKQQDMAVTSAEFDVWRRGTRRTAARAAGTIALLAVLVQASLFVAQAPQPPAVAVEWVAVIALIALWAAVGLTGHVSRTLVALLIVAMPLANLLAAAMPHAGEPTNFAATIFPVATTAAAALYFGRGFFLVLLIAIAAFLISSPTFEASTWDVLPNPIATAIAFWVIASTIWSVAQRADRAHQSAIQEREVQALSSARLEAESEIRGVLHDAVISALMVASMADRGYDDDAVRSAALAGVRELERVDDGRAL